jgi:hydroxymethylpyrimidine/phosphomethylpyrimidine kinase
MNGQPHVPVCLSIAGSDSGGGAGIQADLKAFARCGVHGTTAITALTAQNTVAVTRVAAVEPEMVVAQIEAVATDFTVGAVKIGMLGGAAVIEAVAGALDRLLPGVPVVLDPVMIAESGARLLPTDAEHALVELLLPRATVITPNVPEARVLARAAERRGAASGDAADRDRAESGGGDERRGVESGGGARRGVEPPGGARRGVESPGAGRRGVESPGGHRRDAASGGAEAGGGVAVEELDGADLAWAVRAAGANDVVVTGGHRDEATDVLLAGDRVHEIPGVRHPDGAAHGSGCTHSSSLAAHLARGFSLLEAARAARAIAADAVLHGHRDLGAGAGPVNVLGVGYGDVHAVANAGRLGAPAPA